MKFMTAPCLMLLLGLVNGARGTIKKIWYHPTAKPEEGNLPLVVFVSVDKYSGKLLDYHISIVC